MADSRPDSFSEIILWWDPVADLARELNLPAQNVIKWKERDYIPARYWPRLIRAARKVRRRLTADHLACMAEHRWRDAA